MSYVTNVADLFLSRSSRGAAILNPMDYVIIAEWEKEEIPLDIVLGSINEVCNNLNEEIRIESIEYFQGTVKKNYKNWLQLQSGKN